jgi:hypothetical protein
MKELLIVMTVTITIGTLPAAEWFVSANGTGTGSIGDPMALTNAPRVLTRVSPSRYRRMLSR